MIGGRARWFTGSVSLLLVGCAIEREAPRPPSVIQTPVPQESGGDGGLALTAGAMTVLTCDQDGAAGIALDSAYVYWGDCGDGDNPNGAVMRIAKAGGPPQSLVTNIVCPRAIAVDATSVYWATQGPGIGPAGAVMKAPISGGSPTILASNLGYPGAGITVDSDFVYWTEGTTEDPTGSVKKVALSGGDPVTLASGQRQPGAIVVDGTGLYWLNAGGNGFWGTLMWMSLAGGAPMVLASQKDPGGGLARSSTGTFWTTNDSVLALRTMSPDSHVTIATDQAQVGGLALNGARAYWARWVPGPQPICDDNCSSSPGQNAIGSASLQGGPTTTVAAWTDVDDIGSLAADETNVYWTTSACIMKAPAAGGP